MVRLAIASATVQHFKLTIITEICKCDNYAEILDHMKKMAIIYSMTAEWLY